jgi:hypothetical protein
MFWSFLLGFVGFFIGIIGALCCVVAVFFSFEQSTEIYASLLAVIGILWIIWGAFLCYKSAHTVRIRD